MQRIWFKYVIIPMAICGIALISTYFWLRTSLPQIDGEMRLAGVTVPIEISRTEHGLASIEANSMDDVWFGLGFVHAQDRLWQMMSMRRFALGRLSEIIGEDTLALDIRQRRLGFGRLAKAQFETLDQATQTALIRYADGVNAYLAADDGALPLEFQLLSFDPIPWEPWHGLLWGRLMGHQLSARWREDLARATVLPIAGAAKMREIWPEIPPEIPADAQSSLSDDFLPPLFHPDPKGASNGWAVAPHRSKSGAPLLAGDPHLGLAIPSIWYIARLKAGNRVMEGATTPGVPFVIIGRNNDLAWSVTSNEVDVQDIVVVGRDDITSRITETINIDGEFNENVTVSLFKNAPVINGELAKSGDGEGHALLSTALSANDRSPDALMRLSTAATVDEGIEALKLFVAPFLNVQLADISGDIAQIHAGVVPVRNSVSGRLPLSPAEAWAETDVKRIDSRLRNPSEGYVANANERTADLDQILSGDWPQPARANRIQSLLSQPKSFSIDDMGAFQTDIRDVTWDLWKRVLDGKNFEGEEAQAIIVLREWDGDMRRELAAPLIYSAWMAHIRYQMFADELGERTPTVPLPGPIKLFEMIQNQSQWCDDVESSVVENCDDIPERAFRETVETLTDTLGSDIDDWHWGDTHVAQFRHALLGRIPFFADYYDRRIETDGGDRTLNRGATPRRSSARLGFPHVHGASVRTLHDLGGGPSRYIVGPGQSGNPFSDHYDDLLEPWRDGEYVGFDAPRAGLLKLLPGGN